MSYNPQRALLVRLEEAQNGNELLSLIEAYLAN